MGRTAEINSTLDSLKVAWKKRPLACTRRLIRIPRPTAVREVTPPGLLPGIPRVPATVHGDSVETV